MKGADWDKLFAANSGKVDMDLSHVHEQEIWDLISTRVSDGEVETLVRRLDLISAEETDKRRKIARIIKTLSQFGDVGLKIFKAVT